MTNHVGADKMSAAKEAAALIAKIFAIVWAGNMIIMASMAAVGMAYGKQAMVDTVIDITVRYLLFGWLWG